MEGGPWAAMVVKDPLKWWVVNCHTYLNLYRMVLDYLSILGKLDIVLSYM